MRSLLIVAALVTFAVATVGIANAERYRTFVWDNESFHCKADSANDLHVKYWSDTKMRLHKTYNDAGFTTVTAVASLDSVTWEITWSGATVYFCDTVHVGVKFEQEAENWIEKDDIYWTWNGVPIVPRPVGPGFRVEPYSSSGDDPFTYTIYNSTDSVMTIVGLQLRVSAEYTPLELMKDPLTGFDTPRSDILLNPGESYSEPVNPSIPSPYYVMARGEVEQHDARVGYFFQQHQHLYLPLVPPPIPTLSEWGIIILVLLLVASAFFVMRQRRRAAESRS